MCGICGFTTLPSDTITDNSAIIKDMCDKIAHRGPDGEGYFVSNDVTLGHRRLSLIDLSGGAQPMTRGAGKTDESLVPENGDALTEHFRYTLVFNGEIYNYKDLRKELESEGYAFNRNSDTEVLLIAYIAWGESCLEKLRGMFAFAVWDEEKRTLFCARDYFGIKPFYYTYTKDGRFIFASEIKAIIEHPDYTPEVNYEALPAYMSFQYSALDETFFTGISKLRPGHCMTVKINKDEEDRFAMSRWWIPTYDIEEGGGFNHTAGRVAKAIKNSVSYHKIADVEVGSFLSSGVDSNYLAASLAQQETNIRTFTVGFAEQGIDAQGNADGHKYSEIDYAKEAAEWMDVENISHVITQEEFWETVPKVQWHMDEPLADPAAIALWFVDREAAKNVKTVLSGEGADELFGGYTIYQTPCENEKIQWIPKCILRAGSKVLGKLGIRGANYLHRASTPLIDQFIGNAYIFEEGEVNDFLTSSVYDAIQRNKIANQKAGEGYSIPKDVTRQYYDVVRDLDDTTQMQYIDLNTWLVGDILLKTDKMAMAHSLESRVPFLDKEVWEVARTLPQEMKVSCDESKIILRRAAASIMPAQFTEKKKLGFPVPIRVWLRDDENIAKIMKEVDSVYGRQVFDTDEIRKLIDQHKAGEEDNSRKIWTVYTYLVWHGQYFSNDEEDPNLSDISGEK